MKGTESSTVGNDDYMIKHAPELGIIERVFEYETGEEEDLPENRHLVNMAAIQLYKNGRLEISWIPMLEGQDFRAGEIVYVTKVSTLSGNGNRGELHQSYISYEQDLFSDPQLFQQNQSKQDS